MTDGGDIVINIKDTDDNYWIIYGAFEGRWLPLDPSNLGANPKWPWELIMVCVNDGLGPVTWRRSDTTAYSYGSWMAMEKLKR